MRREAEIVLTFPSGAASDPLRSYDASWVFVLSYYCEPLESDQRNRSYALQYIRNDVTVLPAKSPAGIKIN
jgi:hypothetical protein